MAKKQNPEAIRNEFERMGADLHAWSVTKDGEQVARIVVRYGGRSSPNGLTVRAFVHVLGLPMVRGIARGGGYDMKTAAIWGACLNLPMIGPGNMLRAQQPGVCDTVDAFKALRDQGHDIPHQLRELGYTVDVVM